MRIRGIAKTHLLAVCLSFSAFGHEGIDTQIQSLNKRVLESPQEYQLYLRRADLYRRHKEWNNALKDLERADKLEPGNYESALSRAQLELDRNNPEKSLQILDDLLQHQPDFIPALFVQGRAYAELNKIPESADAFTRGIELLHAPRPDHYLERAKVLASDPRYIEDAIRSIDDGLVTLNNNISLEQYATELEIDNGRLDQALIRVERVLGNNPALPAWLVRKAEILSGLGRKDEAVEAYQAASKGISAFPVRRQNTKAMLALKSRISEGKNAILN